MAETGTSSSEEHEDGAPDSTIAETIFVRIPRLIIAFLILGGIVINFANVVSRHVFSSAIFWAEEILIFLVIWFVSIAVAAVTYQGAHLRMDLLATRIPSPWKQIINAATIICFIAVCGLVVTQSFEAVSAFNRTGMVSITANVPLTLPHAALLVGFTLIVLAVIVRLRAYFNGKF